jgi:hypothetical protein
VLLAVAAPAASIARPIEGAHAARTQPERCFQLNQALPGTARGRHRVACDPAAVAELPPDPASVRTLHNRSASIPRTAITFAVATGALLLAVIAATVARYRRPQRERALT